MKKRILVLALSLVLCLGMMPGMTLVASADSAITLPYSCDFSSEDSMSGWTVVQGVDGTGINDGEFRFKWTTAPPQYLISPELPASKPIVFEFCYRASSSTWPEEFSVGYSTTTNATDQFTWGETISTNVSDMQDYFNTFPAGTKYVAIKHESYDQFYFFIDDISIATETSYNLWIAGTQVTSSNAADLRVIEGVSVADDGEAYYNAETNTLTLKNATITNSTAGQIGAAIQYTGTGDFTVFADGGTNTVSDSATRTSDTYSAQSAGIAVGELEYVSSPPATNLIINVADGASLTVNAGAVTGEGIPQSYGITNQNRGSITIRGAGTLTANGGKSNNWSYGILGSTIINSTGTVEAFGNSDSSNSCGIYTSENGLTINSGEVTAKGKTRALYKAPTLGAGVTAQASTDISGEGAVEYVAGNNNTYKWFLTSYTPITTDDLWVNGIQGNSGNADDVLGDADTGSTVSFAPAADSTPAALTLKGSYLTSIGTGV